MEGNEKVIEYIIKTLNKKATNDKDLKKELKSRFNLNEQGRLRIMSMLMQSGYVEVKRKNDNIIYRMSSKMNVKKSTKLKATKTTRLK